MKSTILYCALILMALAAAGPAVFHASAPAALTSQPQGTSPTAGGLRVFEIVPLETVSEKSANATARERFMVWPQPIWMATAGRTLSWRDPMRPAL
jgi:hypothetical protein